jgi:hypothetical protein
MRLPASYLRARRNLGNREIDLDWRKLGRKEPRMWPGMLWLWTARDARRENSERRPSLDSKLRDRLFLIGTNTAGVVFAIDARGRVVIMDEIEMDYPVTLGGDFSAFEKCFVTAPEKREALRERDRADALRRMPARWRKLDAILDGRHRLSRTANVHAILVDIANHYLLAGRTEALLEALRTFAARHPRRKSLVAKLRKYVKQWGKAP